ncbi:putative protein phosphatase methylesterase 1 [Dissostichus eleginoides]|uniref:Uncharacterized protein n=1 Tax=Dissostichus eleginoides TaxID=100907 RepID=A0AAD9FH87_DISEL|nr:putative protein phosphatase methylesterase 1 [Dissostichus eleginoides]
MSEWCLLQFSGLDQDATNWLWFVSSSVEFLSSVCCEVGVLAPSQRLDPVFIGSRQKGRTVLRDAVAQFSLAAGVSPVDSTMEQKT